MGREIKADADYIEQMIADGELHFGDELELSRDGRIWVGPIDFFGFNKKDMLFDSALGLYNFARFPLPDLRDGDPIIVSHNLSKIEKSGVRRHFKRWLCSDIVCYNNGQTGWTVVDKIIVTRWAYWRTPTQAELMDAGINPEHFAGRRGITIKD